MPNAGSGDGVAGNTPSNQGGQRADMQQGTTGSKGGGGNHKHPSSYQTVKGPLQTTHSLNVKYMDVILCLDMMGIPLLASLLILDLDDFLFLLCE